MEDAENFQKIKDSHDGSELLDAEVREKIDRLSKRRYEPLYGFLVKCLDDPNPGWREKSLAKIHYFKSKINEKVLAKIRKIALTDSDVEVRVRACGTLGNISKWPEDTLSKVIEQETEPFVLGAATSSILLLRGIPPYIALEQFNKISTKEVQPSLDYIEKIILNRVKN